MNKTTKVLSFAFAMFALVGLVTFPTTAHANYDEGCTPGFWKANAKKNNADQWPSPITPDTKLSEFAASNAMMTSSVSLTQGMSSGVDLDNTSFIDALKFKGGPDLEGKERILLRAAAAGILNAESSSVAYPYVTYGFIHQTNLKLATDDLGFITYSAELVDRANNLGCPLNNSGK